MVVTYRFHTLNSRGNCFYSRSSKRVKSSICGLYSGSIGSKGYVFGSSGYVFTSSLLLNNYGSIRRLRAWYGGIL
jgi:hypothetical protein